MAAFANNISNPIANLNGRIVTGHKEYRDNTFTYTIYYNPHELTDDNKEKIIKLFGNRIQKGEKCLGITEKIVRNNIKTKNYDALIYIKNDKIDDTATGALQYRAYCKKNSSKQLWISDLCRVNNSPIGSPHISPIRVLLDVIEETQGNIIIWATYRNSIKLIRDSIAKVYGASKVATFFGDTESEERQEIVKNFQSGEIRFFVGQPRTGGYGITLTNAKTVIYFNNTYDMEVRLQSEDRAHRIGQKDKVTYIDFVCPNTLDEKIIQVLNNKKKLADEITGDKWKQLFA